MVTRKTSTTRSKTSKSGGKKAISASSRKSKTTSTTHSKGNRSTLGSEFYKDLGKTSKNSRNEDFW